MSVLFSFLINLDEIFTYHTSMHTHTHTYIYIYIYINKKSMYVYTYTQAYIYTDLKHTHIYIYTNTHKNIYRCLYIYIYTHTHTYTHKCTYHHHHHHHHHVVLLAQISLTLSRHFSLSFIASGMSSGLHPVSSHSCCMYVLASCPAFTRPYVGVYRSTSLMSSSLLLQQRSVCLVRLTLIVFLWWEAGGRIVGALWGVAARTCLILLATFLCVVAV